MPPNERLPTAAAVALLMVVGLAAAQWGSPPVKVAAVAFTLTIANALPNVWARLFGGKAAGVAKETDDDDRI